MRPIEHQAARALEKLSLRLAMRQVDGARHSELPLAHHLFENVLAPLGAPIGRQHRIQRHGAVAVKAHPIVGENGVRLGRPQGVGRNQDFHAGTLQRRRQSVELAQGQPLRFGLAGRRRLLEGVAGRRLRIEPETRRPHQEHRPGALRFLDRR